MLMFGVPLLPQLYLAIDITYYSRFSWVYLLKKKSKVFSVFSQFKITVENLSSTTIKTFRLDGGGEFINKKFQELFQSTG